MKYSRDVAVAVIFLVFAVTTFGFTISGPGITSPTSAYVRISVDGNFDPSYTYLIFRGINNLTFDRWFGYTTDSQDFPITSKVSLVEPINETHAEPLLAQLKWSKPHFFSVFLMKAIRGSYMITVFPPGIIITGPLNNVTSLAWSNSPDFLNARIEPGIDPDNVFPHPLQYYGSVMYKYVFRIMESRNATCRFRMRYRGIAFIYLDGYLIGLTSSTSTESDSLYILQNTFSFSPSELTTLDLYGPSLYISSLELIECYYSNSPYTELNYVPEIELYSFVSQEASVATPNIGNSVTCPSSSCATCAESSKCIQCKDGFAITLSQGCNIVLRLGIYA
jgi:hypothetical protein